MRYMHQDFLIHSLRFVSSKVRSICTYIRVNDTMNAVFGYVKSFRLSDPAIEYLILA